MLIPKTMVIFAFSSAVLHPFYSKSPTFFFETLHVKNFCSKTKLY